MRVSDPIRNLWQPRFGSRPIATVVDNVYVLIWGGVVFHRYWRPQRKIHRTPILLRQRIRVS